MTARSRPEWIGAKPESMPPQSVFLRLYAKQNGICACGCGMVMNLNRDRVVRDHRIPLRDGGENRENNLQIMLEAHHIPKTVEENQQRAVGNRWQAKAFPELRKRKATFPTNRDGKWKRKMDGTLVRRDA
jgi:5-methylcytosine-specific restriction protein A